MAGPRTTGTTRSEDEILAAATAGHVMAGMPPTETDQAAARRVLRGHSTVEEELATLHGELQQRRMSLGECRNER